MSVKDSLELFGKRLIQQSKSNLSKKDKKDTSGLYNSLKYEVNVHKNSFSLVISMEDYGHFVDKGVRGKTSSKRAPKSPYKFGTGSGKSGGLTNGINAWVKRKRIQFKDKKTGKFISYKATAFMITRAVWNKGLETTNFITTPFENELKKLPDEIITKYGLEVNSLIKMAFKK